MLKHALLGLALGGLVSAGLVGCAPGQNTAGATVVGAAAGGLLGGAIFGGGSAVPGILAGALIGGSIGYLVGRHMDRQDRVNMQNAIINTPVGQQASWTNNKTHVTYVVRPVSVYQHRGWKCRRYMTRVKIEGRWRTAYGRACKTPRGWKLMN